MAASTMQKCLASPSLRHCTSASTTSALPTSERPSLQQRRAVPVDAGIQACQPAGHQFVGPWRLLACAGDAQVTDHVHVVDRNARRFDRCQKVEQPVQRTEPGRGLRDLRPDGAVDGHPLQAWQRCRVGVRGQRAVMGHFRQPAKRRLAFDVEAAHTHRLGRLHFSSSFADTRELDAIGLAASGQRTVEFAARTDVEPASGAGKGLQHRQAGLGLPA